MEPYGTEECNLLGFGATQNTLSRIHSLLVCVGTWDLLTVRKKLNVARLTF